MTVNIEIPDDRAARFEEHARARGLTVDRWLLELAEQHSGTCAPGSPRGTLVEVCARVRGIADDLDFSRDSSTGRDVAL